MEYKEVTDIVAGAHNVLDRLEVKIRKSWVSRIFWHSVRVRWFTPPVILGTSWELDHPYRKGGTLIVRYWWSRCWVLGFWGKTEYDEDHALLSATIHGRDRTDDERHAFDDTTKNLEGPATGDSDILGGRSNLRDGATRDA
jgi:hypothetical protein